MKTFTQSAREYVAEGKRLLALQPEGKPAIVGAWRMQADQLRCPKDSDGLCDCGKEGPDRHRARAFVLREVQQLQGA